MRDSVKARLTSMLLVKKVSSIDRRWFKKTSSVRTKCAPTFLLPEDGVELIWAWAEEIPSPFNARIFVEHT